MNKEELFQEIDRLDADIQKIRYQLQQITEYSKEIVTDLNNITRRVKHLSKLPSPTPQKPTNWYTEPKFNDQIYSSDLQRILQVESYPIGAYVLNTRLRVLEGHGEVLKLTQKEMFLMAIFAANVNVFVDREFCLNVIWRENLLI